MASIPLKPLCFVLMPFGQKPDATGRKIDFDAVYAQIIAPAVHDAGLEPLRADEERSGGIIHKPMFERLVLCDYAVADLTTANANVFYELGVRHAAKRRSTVLVFHQGGGQMPFDVGLLRALPYGIDPGGQPCNAAHDRAELAKRLVAARHPDTDSPLYELLDDYPDVAHTKTDVFRARVAYAENLKRQLASIRAGHQTRAEKIAAIGALEAGLGTDLQAVEAGLLVDLLLSYRSVDAWTDMIGLCGRLPPPLDRTVLVREQYAFALNRTGQGEDAEQVLHALIGEHGNSSETLGLLGRVYKDRWQQALADGRPAPLAAGLLERAIDAYRRGFEADWRDAYPGINAVTLMECRNPPSPERLGLLPVVSYAVRRRTAGSHRDYWDHAAELELAVLRQDEPAIEQHLGAALALLREDWERATTLRNLTMIWTARAQRGVPTPERIMVEQALSISLGH
jgi:hypothetical protein